MYVYMYVWVDRWIRVLYTLAGAPGIMAMTSLKSLTDRSEESKWLWRG